MNDFIQRTIDNTKRDHRERTALALLSYGLLVAFLITLIAGMREIASLLALVSIVVYVLIYRR